MAEEKEQLRIEAELETSNLKQQAQEGMQTIVEAEKEVEEQSKKTSDAVDAIGTVGKEVGETLAKAGSKTAETLGKVSQSGKVAGQAVQQGMQSATASEKRLDNQSKQTAKSVEEVGQKGKVAGQKLQTAGNQGSQSINKVSQEGQNAGQSLQEAGNAGTTALRQIGDEADRTTGKVAEIAKVAKEIKLKQGIGLAAQAITALAPVGQSVAKGLGMSDTSVDVLGGTINGAASGAMMGSLFGAPGAAIGAGAGALAGAATALLEAAKLQKEAAKDLIKASGERAEETVTGYADTKYKEETQRRVEGFLENPDTVGKLNEEIADLLSTINEKKETRTELAEDIDAVSNESAEGLSGRKRIDFDTERAKRLDELTNAYDKNESEIAKFEERLRALQAVFQTLNNGGFVGPEIPEHILEERNNVASNAQTTKQIDNKEEETRYKTNFENQFRNLVKTGKFDDAEKMLNDETVKVSQAKEDASTRLHSETVQRDNNLYQKAKEDNDKANSDIAGISRLKDVLAKAKLDYDKSKDMGVKAEEQNKVQQLKEEIAPQQEFASKLSNMKLTDSLTQIGGGSGYGVQMQGISSYVKGISTNIAAINKVIANCLDVIKSIDAKYAPYGGQFISEQDN